MKKIVITDYKEFGAQNDIQKMQKILIVMGDENMEAQDGFHSFGELYDHRITLYIALCKMKQNYWRQVVETGFDEYCPEIWRSKKHSDGGICFGTGSQFILGIGKEKGQQISYHIPIERWDETNFVQELEKAPEWDGHTPDDVLGRLQLL